MGVGFGQAGGGGGWTGTSQRTGAEWAARGQAGMAARPSWGLGPVQRAADSLPATHSCCSSAD